MLSALLANISYAENIRILNKNFESDVLPVNPAKINYISGWVSSGAGATGIMIPEGNGVHYNGYVPQAQVAYLDAGGRISQNVGARLENGETYTLSFDVGRRLDQIDRNMVVRIKADGLVVAYMQSDDFSSQSGEWSTESFSFTATQDMPLGKQIAIEITNLSVGLEQQVNIDNLVFKKANTGKVLTVNRSIELRVPERYPDIPSALAYLDDKLIQAGVEVTLKVSDCSNQIYASPIQVSHVNSQFIKIIGNTQFPENCVLQFNGSDGFVISDGNKLLGLDGFTIRGSGISNTSGLKVVQGSLLKTGENIIVSNFHYGLHADRSSTAFVGNVIFEDNLHSGLYASNSSKVFAPNSVARNNSTYGFYAYENSLINAAYSLSDSNDSIGFIGYFGSTFLLDYSAATQNELGSYQSSYGSNIYAERPEAYSDIRNSSGANYKSWLFSFQFVPRLISQKSQISQHYSPRSTWDNDHAFIKF